MAEAAPAQVAELLGGRRGGRAAPGPAAGLVAGHGGGDRGWLGAGFPHGEAAAGEDGGHGEGGDGDPPRRPPPGWA
ncbi:MAG TPA: hypothetical protein VGR74_04770 [Actinomycetota bacterium]|nr:hypothetical protein [Actinomycetota bacterium]